MSVLHHHLVTDAGTDVIKTTTLLLGKLPHHPMQITDALVGGGGGMINDQDHLIRSPQIPASHFLKSSNGIGSGGVTGHDGIDRDNDQLVGPNRLAHMLRKDFLNGSLTHETIASPSTRRYIFPGSCLSRNSSSRREHCATLAMSIPVSTPMECKR